MAEQPQRVTTSLETLRTEIRLANAELEIRLMDKLATKEELETIRLRLSTLEATQEGLERDKAGRDAVRGVVKFTIGGGILTTLILLIQLGITIYLVSNPPG